jgi:flagellar hook assembly protein FlgD
MFKAYHDTMSVVTVVDVKQPVAGAVSAQNISITNSTIQFICAEASPVVVSIYSLSGHCVGTILDQTLTKGTHTVRWNARSGDGTSMAPGLYTVRLKINDREYHAQLNVLR